jgi:hypothetical protein
LLLLLAFGFYLLCISSSILSLWFLCVIVSNVCLLQTKNSWILFSNSISQSVSFNWRVKTIYI